MDAMYALCRVSHIRRMLICVSTKGWIALSERSVRSLPSGEVSGKVGQLET